MVELRQQRLVVARLVASIGIPDPDHVDRHRHGESMSGQVLWPWSSRETSSRPVRPTATPRRPCGSYPPTPPRRLYNVTLTLAGWVVTPRCSTAAPDHPRGEAPLRSSVRAFQ